MNEKREKRLAKHQFKIGGMHCSLCSSTISKTLSKLPGVIDVNVSLAHEEVLVHYDPSKLQKEKIEQALQNIGYSIRDPNKIRGYEQEEMETRDARNRLFGSAGLTFTALGIMLLRWLGIVPSPMPLALIIAMIALALANVFGFGYPILKMAYFSLKRGILNQHVLMEFAAFGGIAGGFMGILVYRSFPAPDFFAIATFITSYHLLGGYASLRVRTTTSQAVRRLLSLQPDKATLVKDGQEIVVPTSQVKKGDIVRVKPGESIPVDGVVIDGYTSVDESLVTGEPIPSKKQPGSEVIGGSVNRTGSILVRAEKVGEESFLRQVANHIEEARATKPSILQLLDVVLKYFVPGVVILAVSGFLAWSLGAWLVTGVPDLKRAVFAAISSLVMGYPCALGMGTPLAMIRGQGLAAEKGILFRSSESFHVFRNIDTLILDKTGTITYGKPEVTEIHPFWDYTSYDVLAFAASVESLSEHPLAKAIVKKAHEEGISVHQVKNFMSYPGNGVSGLYEGRTVVVVGSLDFVVSFGCDSSILPDDLIEKMEEKGITVVAVGYDGKLAGVIGISDTVKEDAKEVISYFKKIGIETIMITGDSERTANSVAEEVGIQRVFAKVSPNKKAEFVRSLQSEGHKVMMVGDGINDAPALMQADVGIAIGAGTDIAIESADVIIIGDRLGAILDAYNIGLNSYSKTKQNLALAFLFNGIGVPIAATGLVNPAWAMVAMALSVTAVITNSFGGKLVVRNGKKEKPAAMISKIELEVPSAHCSRCFINLTEAISDVEQVISVETDQERKLILVTYRGGPSVKELILNEVRAQGHKVKVHQTS